jgi:signal transduction histidine kinase
MANQAPGGERPKRGRVSTRAPKRALDPLSPPAKTRDPLLSSICHDLRAPLAAVTMGANFVLQTTERDEANARSVKILEAMLRSCSQMERLIRNFADLSEIEGDALTLRLGLHDAGEMLELTALATKDAASARSVSIELSKPSDPISMRCDRERLLRAIGHVVENAVKHATAESKVRLGVTLDGDDVSFSIVDSGPGLSPEAKTHLYDRQWHAQRADRVGSGFGLAIARGVVVAHDGRIDVESQPNVETTFTLVVPKNGPRG